MLSQKTVDQIIKKIHSYPEFAGCMIGFEGDGQSRLLHGGFSAGPHSDRIVIVIEEVPAGDAALDQELLKWSKSAAGSPEGSPNPSTVTNRSRLGPELLGAGFQCGLTIVSAIGVLGSAAGEVPSGGTSTFLLVASWTGMITGGVQCANGLVRIKEIVFAPDDNSLERWDKNPWYSGIMLVVDGLGVASGLAQLPAALGKLLKLFNQRAALGAAGLTEKALREMNRAQRQQAVKKLVEELSKSKEGRDALGAFLRETGKEAKTFVSMQKAPKLVRILSDSTVRSLQGELLNIFISGVAQPAVSGMPARWVGSGSGSVNWLINVVDAGKPSS
ncbi:MAG: hypothetical protein IT186_06845 [Acidobacteria bacterium]|nr:hypothetical protein [Acidobacteriota bacterium]